MCRADERGYVPMAEPPIYVNLVNPTSYFPFRWACPIPFSVCVCYDGFALLAALFPLTFRESS